MRGGELILKGILIQISVYWQQYTSFHILLQSKYFSSIHLTTKDIIQICWGYFYLRHCKNLQEKNPNLYSVSLLVIYFSKIRVHADYFFWLDSSNFFMLMLDSWQISKIYFFPLFKVPYFHISPIPITRKKPSSYLLPVFLYLSHPFP